MIASGGVSRYEDLEALAAHADKGVAGAIIGKALYTGSIELAEAHRRLGLA
ncbi:Phosphoribosyl isomerase A [compost metagenome]